MAIIGSVSLILTLCTAMGCNSYDIDNNPEWHNPKDCREALVVESDYMARIWHNQARLKAYVTQFDVVEPVTMLTDYDFTCEVNKSQWVKATLPNDGRAVVFK